MRARNSACEFLSDNSGNNIEPEYLGISPAQLNKGLPDALKQYRDKFDIVFTHNRMGEYGHEDHKLVYKNVIDNISHENTWLFISPGSWNVNQNDLRSKKENGNRKMTLTPEILQLRARDRNVQLQKPKDIPSARLSYKYKKWIKSSKCPYCRKALEVVIDETHEGRNVNLRLPTH